MQRDAQADHRGTRRAACSSDDRPVKTFDALSGGKILVADLRRHEGPVWRVAWAHPVHGNVLASCSYDRKEENGTWEKTHGLTGHDSSVNSVCWAPHDYGPILACASSDGAISLLTYTRLGRWEVKKTNSAHAIGCNAVSWAPAVGPGSLTDQPSGQKPSYIKTLAFAVAVAVTTSPNHVAWAPSIGLPTSTIASCSQDGPVFIWACEGASGSAWSPKLLHKFSDVVRHGSQPITAHILAASRGDNRVTLWKESIYHLP
uniref:Protein SEC13 homolog n=1 Tax=Phocoena sinus TaxID=42100 RepID=A0A8C9CLD4_PHOSS